MGYFGAGALGRQPGGYLRALEGVFDVSLDKPAHVFPEVLFAQGRYDLGLMPKVSLEGQGVGAQAVRILSSPVLSHGGMVSGLRLESREIPSTYYELEGIQGTNMVGVAGTCRRRGCRG